jgi:cytoskeletal protein CcmA (bactofilin family)
VKAKQGVEIRNPGRLNGNLETPSLIIEKGVIFQGQAKMENLGKPISAPPPVFPGAKENNKGKNGDKK